MLTEIRTHLTAKNIKCSRRHLKHFQHSRLSKCKLWFKYMLGHFLTEKRKLKTIFKICKMIKTKIDMVKLPSFLTFSFRLLM